MISLKMALVPYASRLMAEADLLTIELYTVPFGKEPKHGYVVLDNNGHRLADGEVPKTKSGHRNPLHLLKAVLNDLDLDALGTNYITTEYDNDEINAAES